MPHVNSRPLPKRPNREAIDKHRVTHTPYQPWCRACVQGRAVATAHERQTVDHESSESKVAFDWAHLRDKPGGDLACVLVGVDKRTNRRFAVHAMDKQGGNAETVEQVVVALKRMGHYGPVTIQSDGEPCLVDLLERVAAMRGSPTVLVRSPVADSQSNGLVERAVREIECMCRTLKCDLESRLGRAVSVHEPIFSWLIRHSSMILNWQSVGRDGKTPPRTAEGQTLQR